VVSAVSTDLVQRTDGKVLLEIPELVDSGLIKPCDSAIIPSEVAQKSHKLVDSSQTPGKIVL